MRLVLTLLAFAASLFSQSGELLGDPAALAAPGNLALIKGRTSTVFAGEKGKSQFNLHSYLARFDGRFFAAWSSAAGREEDPDQQILYATSADGHSWSSARVLATDPDGPQGPQRWITRGLYVENGRLYALGARVGSANYGQRGKGVVWEGLTLVRFGWDGKGWKELGVFAANCMNNFPPERLGKLLFMPCRDANMDLYSAFADPADPTRWTMKNLAAPPPFERLDEPSWYTGPDGVAHLIIRDNNRSRRLIHMFSRDKGESWSAAVQTNYPDATSKNFVGRLSTGAYFLINNPNPEGRDPLAIAYSRDGWSFFQPAAIRNAAPAPKFGRGKGTVQYPHAIEHGGSLWVIYSTNKEDIQVTQIPIILLP